MEDAPGPVVVRTPATTRVSAGMRRLLRHHWVVWVREEAGGPVEGLSGAPLRWQDGALVPGERDAGFADRDSASVRVQVVHAYDDAHDVGVLVERVLDRLGGLASTRCGATEPALGLWDRPSLARAGQQASPEPVLWFVNTTGAAGTLTLLPGRSGILEEIDLEVPGEVDETGLWEAVADLVPVLFTTTAGTELTTAVVHEQFAESLGPDVEVLGQGYLTVLRPGPDGREQAVTKRLPPGR